MKTTVTIQLSRVADAIVASYKWNSTQEHLLKLSGIQLILSEEDYKLAADMAKEIIERNNITKQVKG